MEGERERRRERELTEDGGREGREEGGGKPAHRV